MIDGVTKGTLLGVQVEKMVRAASVEKVAVQELQNNKEPRLYEETDIIKAREDDAKRVKDTRGPPAFLQLPRIWTYRTYLYDPFMQVYQVGDATIRKFSEALSLPLVRYKGQPSMGQVFETLRANGITVLIVGGAVRDALSDDVRKLRNIDIGFLGSFEKLNEILVKQWDIPPLKFSDFFYANGGGANSRRGQQQLPSCWEQTSIGGADRLGVRVQFKALPIGPKDPINGITRRITFDLVEDSKSRDFTVNALWYDPVNQVVIDPLGRGWKDFRNRVLQPVVVTTSNAPSHIQVLRYYKMRNLGFKKNEELDTSMKRVLQDLFLKGDSKAGDFFKQLSVKERKSLIEYIALRVLSVDACNPFIDNNIDANFFNELRRKFQQNPNQSDD